MKNMVRVFVVTVIALWGFASYGQFGVKGGLGISSLVLKNNDVNFTQEFGNAGFSFHLGGGYEIGFTDEFRLEPSFLLTQKNSSFDINNLITNKLLYLELPVNFKFYFIDFDVAKLYGLAGGYTGFLLSAKQDNDKLRIGSKRNDDIKLIDFGINFGAGAQFFDALNVDLSAGIGVANLTNDVRNGGKTKNNVVRLTVTYQFGG